ncbi:putative carboxypeptidase precursor [Rhypophila decipiens]|uniref:Carboxypeptidase n=1 Tax=Rhypophila decipiens TaxID=261697 RepID=A0AAN6XSR4_9PEZI|nr:putative carboxypeptidase precursor [Rhypophila decipiens]
MKLTSIVTQLLLAPLALAAAAPKVNQKITYDGYKVFRISTHHDAAIVKDLLKPLTTVAMNLKDEEHLDVAIAPQDLDAFDALNLDAEVLHEDLGSDIKAESKFGTYGGVSARAVPSLTWWNSYHAYADHITFYNDLAGAFPNNSEIFNIGTSVQGRQIFGLHIWGSGGKGSKPAVYFHGTVHAREWISAKVVEYISYQLLTQYSTDLAVMAIVDKYDFYILPFVNPDGFVYSQTNDRLWRKNRQTRSGSSCVGTDINRNWPYKWSLTGGASTNKCSETYKGQAASDTPENAALVAFTTTLKNSHGIKLYIDWHSFGQYILLPYGYDCTQVAANNAQQTTLAIGLKTRIALSYGTQFTYGPSCSTLYKTTGSSADYMTDVALTEFAWTIELRPTGSSSSGFILPPAQILPSSIEQWEGMKYLLPIM